MKATFGGLAAILVSTVALSAAHAQYPPAIPVSSAPVFASAPVTSLPDAGCATCGGSKLLGSWGWGHGGGCNSCGGGLLHKDGCGCGLVGGFCGWLKGPFPSDAPTIRKPQPPLGFPTHPYARSPRDYFMMDDP